MRFRLFIVLLVSSVCFETRPVFGRSDILPTSALTRGMTGIGRTVFQGTKIDTFEVEILGVLKNARGAKSDVILARLSGGPIDRANGIAGMSGSPVYVDGKMIGAVALAYPYSKEAIIGITPIQEMLEILVRTNEDPDPRVGALTEPTDQRLDPYRPGALKPVVMPLVASGFSPSVVEELHERLSGFGLMPVQGAGGADGGLPDVPLEPGSALGVQLVRGDLNLTTIGTLTYIDGDRLVGFGHSVLFTGSTSLPMTSAYIHDVVPSQFLSFKLGSAVRPVGVVTQDRAPGVGGVIGAPVDMMPLSIVVRSGSKSETYAMEVLRDRNFGPLFTQASVVSALITAEQAAGEVTVRTLARVKVEGHEPLELRNVYAGPLGLGESVGGVTRPFEQLVRNPYERVRVEGVTFELEVVESVRAARIERVRLDRSQFEPADMVKLRVTLRPYLGDAKEVETTVKLPDFVKDQRLTLRVSSAESHNTADAKRVPDEYRPKGLAQLIDKLHELPRNDELVIELSSPRRGVTVDGREMASLPPSVLATLMAGRESGSVRTVRSSVLSEERVTTDFVLSGSQTVLIHVGAEEGALRFGGRPMPAQQADKNGR